MNNMTADYVTVPVIERWDGTQVDRQGISKTPNAIPLSTPLAVLGVFKPTPRLLHTTPAAGSSYGYGIDFIELENEFRAWLTRHEIMYTGQNMTVRDPHFNKRIIINNSDAAEWHQDCNRDDRSLFQIVWSNAQPTIVRLRSDPSTILTTHIKPFEVLFVNNLVCEHRTPDSGPSDNRWFIRLTPPLMKLGEFLK